MKKLICVFLVVVMALTTFSLTVSAANDETDGWKTTYSIATDDKGNLLTAHNLYGKEWSISESHGLGANDSTKSPSPGEGIIIFEEKANYIEATFKRGSGDVSDPWVSGILFCVADRSGNWTFWNGNYNYYWLAFDANNVLHIYRCYDHGCYDQNGGFIEPPDLVKEADRIDLDDVELGGVKFNLSELAPGGTFKLAAEWDNEGHIKAYVNGELVYTVTDENPLQGDYHGVRMRVYFKNRLYVNSYTAYVKTADGGTTNGGTTNGGTTNGGSTDTGDATTLIAIVAVVALMGTGIFAYKKRRFN